MENGNIKYTSTFKLYRSKLSFAYTCMKNNKSELRRQETYIT